MRLLGIGLGLAVTGAGFIAVAIWPFLLPAIADLRAGHTVLFTATKGAGVTWSHVYTLRDHPAYFAVGVLTKILGGIAFGGLGLFLSVGGLLRAFGPADIRLWVFPYLLRYGVLS